MNVEHAERLNIEAVNIYYQFSAISVLNSHFDVHRFYIPPETWNPDDLVLPETKRITPAMFSD